jgi:hypothetical protein
LEATADKEKRVRKSMQYATRRSPMVVDQRGLRPVVDVLTYDPNKPNPTKYVAKSQKHENAQDTEAYRYVDSSYSAQLRLGLLLAAMLGAWARR